MAERLRLATRGSKLALAQSRWVAAELVRAHPGLEVELVIIRTRGDALTEHPLPAVGGKGLFTREIEEALLRGEADLAVHSLKDLPITSPPGLVLAALTSRVDPRDALVSRSGADLAHLPKGARVGTSSPRRTAQLAHQRPDLHFTAVRGNVDTRLRKLHDGQYDAIILAGAGLIRLGMQSQVTQWLPVEICTPAPGQGILAVQTRQDAGHVIQLAQAVASEDSLVCATAERAALQGLGGGCQTPAGFLCTVHGDQCILYGAVSDPGGYQCLRARLSGSRTEAAELGKRLAEQLLSAGAHRWVFSPGP